MTNVDVNTLALFRRKRIRSVFIVRRRNCRCHFTGTGNLTRLRRRRFALGQSFFGQRRTEAVFDRAGVVFFSFNKFFYKKKKIPLLQAKTFSPTPSQ